MSTRLNFVGILICPLLVLGCRKPPPAPAPPPAAGLVTYSLRIADRITGTPVGGAEVSPYCGIPGFTNRYLTDRRGSVEFERYGVNGTMAIIRAEGYMTTNISVPFAKPPATVLLERAP